MYLMYVDESGDPGLANSPTQYFVLTGLVVHELRWHPYLDQLVQFRQRYRSKFSLKLREEIHAAHLINKPKELSRIKRHHRLEIVRALAKELATMTDLNLINVVVRKAGKSPTYDAFSCAWKALVQRFENTIGHRNFRGPANADERGLLFPDHCDNRKLTRLLRQMRHYNPVPHQPQFGQGYRNLTLAKITEDPSFRDSAHSYFVQACDLAAFLLYQRLSPNSYMKKNSGQNYFRSLGPILCRVASTTDPDGIVWP